LICGNQVESSDLRNQLKEEHSIVWEVEIEEGNQDYELEGIDSAPYHLQ